MNSVQLSKMNDGVIIDCDGSVYLLNSTDAAGYPEDFLESASKQVLEEIGAEYMYNMYNN